MFKIDIYPAATENKKGLAKVLFGSLFKIPVIFGGAMLLDAV
jgi:hypothetical protein